MRTWNIIAIAAVAVLSQIGRPAEAGARGRGSTVRQSVELQPTGLDADARGRATLQVRGGSNGRFQLKVGRLDGDSTYEVLVDDVRVGAIDTDAGGSGRLRLRSRPRSSKEEFLGFDPRGMMLLVRDGAGGDVLVASIPSGGATGSNEDIVCCVPDDSGPECEDRTADECAAAGGTVSAATSCLPNPCAGTPPPAGMDVICCIPDDSGPECEDRTPDECALQGGVVVEASSCVPNPCAATAPSDPDIRCCLPDDSGSECEDRTPAECEAQGGVNLGAGSCTPNPCADVVPPPDGGTASVRVRCERRASRSKISVDGSGLAAGSYRARTVSGASDATSALAAAVNGQAEFDFDSDGGDIAEGATPIAATFIQGAPPQVLGQILAVDGTVVAEAVASCEVR